MRSSASAGGADRRLRRLLKILEHDAAGNVGELARLLEVTPSHLEHLFKSSTGVSLRDFLIDRRLQKGADLLLTTSLSIKYVALTVGYRHPSSFTRAFIRHFGTAPLPYRNRFC